MMKQKPRKGLLERIKVRLSKREPKASDKVLQRTEVVRKNAHARYLPWLIALVVLMGILFAILDVVLMALSNSPDSLVIAVGVEAIIVATVIGVWTSLFNAEVVSLTSADMTITIGEKIDELVHGIRTESEKAVLEQKEFTVAVVGAIQERSAEEMEVLRNVSIVLETLNEQLGEHAEALRELGEAERGKIEAMQEAEQEKIEAARRQIDIEIKKARPILNLNLRASGVLTQNMLMSISPRSNDVRNLVVNVTAAPPGRKPIEWEKSAKAIPAGGAKVWNLGDVGRLPSPAKTEFKFTITYEDSLGTPYAWEPRATVHRWGILGKGFRVEFK